MWRVLHPTLILAPPRRGPQPLQGIDGIVAIPSGVNAVARAARLKQILNVGGSDIATIEVTFAQSGNVLAAVDESAHGTTQKALGGAAIESAMSGSADTLGTSILHLLRDRS